MKSSPGDKLAKPLSSRFVFLLIFLTFVLLLLLTACVGLSSLGPSATKTPTKNDTLSLAPATINFGTVQLNSVATGLVSVTNVGPSPETIESATVVTNPIFSIQSWTGPVTLDPGQTVQLRTIFAPQSAGNYSGTLTLAMPLPLAPINIPLIGAAGVENNPPPIGVSLSPTSAALQTGQSKQFEAAVTGTSNTAVTWTATLGSITSSGLYTAPTVTSQTSDTISAISVADPSKSASASVTLTSASLVVGVSLSPTSAALQSGQSQQFAAAVTGTSNTAVTWTATLGSIASSGLYTAPTVTSQTSDTISAISVADPSKSASGLVTVTIGSSTGAAYSLNANSVTTKPLPSDVLSHCFGDTSNCAAGDAIAQCAMTDCGNLSELGNPTYMGTFTKSTPGANDLGTPLYSSFPTDPFYSITASTPSGLQTITFHAPNAASFTEGPGDEFLAVWDQTTGWVVSLYAYGAGHKLPAASGCGSTSATACVISNQYQSAASNLFTAQDYGYIPSPPDSNGVGPFAVTTKEQELLEGVINHALSITIDCVNSIRPYVFPSLGIHAGICGTLSFGAQNVNRPSEATLIFCDYTSTQIASFNLPAWQATLLTAFCTYGAYVKETTSANNGIVFPHNESSEPWKYYGLSYLTDDPFWPWIITQKGLDGTANLGDTGCITSGSTYRCVGSVLANIPRTLGPEGSDAEGNPCPSGSGCYPSGHIHVADKCIAEGYAGVAGGCF